MLELLLAASATALATGLGAMPVFFLGARAEALTPALLGLAGGVMTVAAVAGFCSRRSTRARRGRARARARSRVPARRPLRSRTARPRASAAARTSVLVFFVLFVHSLPEGFAIGTAYASETEGLGLFVSLAIAIQNIPEGTSVAIPMAAAGYSAARQFWAAVATSLPQPVGAVIAYPAGRADLRSLPVSFAFAAGAMLALVVVEVAPQRLAASVGGRSSAARSGPR